MEPNATKWEKWKEFHRTVLFGMASKNILYYTIIFVWYNSIVVERVYVLLTDFIHFNICVCYPLKCSCFANGFKSKTIFTRNVILVLFLVVLHARDFLFALFTDNSLFIQRVFAHTFGK